MTREFDLLERIAALEHDQWIELTKHILSEIKKHQGLLYIGGTKIEEWVELFKPYSELTEEEKEKDRVFARRVISALEAHFNLIGRARMPDLVCDPWTHLDETSKEPRPL